MSPDRVTNEGRRQGGVGICFGESGREGFLSVFAPTALGA
jgi:hypothetical protein